MYQFDSYRTSLRENGNTGPRLTRVVDSFPHSTPLHSPSLLTEKPRACGLCPRFRSLFPLRELSEPRTPYCFFAQAPPSWILNSAPHWSIFLMTSKTKTKLVCHVFGNPVFGLVESPHLVQNPALWLVIAQMSHYCYCYPWIKSKIVCGVPPLPPPPSPTEKFVNDSFQFYLSQVFLLTKVMQCKQHRIWFPLFIGKLLVNQNICVITSQYRTRNLCFLTPLLYHYTDSWYGKPPQNFCYKTWLS